MMQSPLGPNIEGFSNLDRNYALATMRQWQPRACVVANDVDLAVDIQAARPRTLVIFRFIPPPKGAGDGVPGDSHHDKYSAQEWIRMHEPFAARGLCLYVNNEPNGYGDLSALDAWTGAIIEHFAPRGVRLCVLNFGTGHPKEGGWKELHKTLALASRYRDRVTIGLHEYGVRSLNAPGRVGRFYELQMYYDDWLKLPRPGGILTEYGLDNDGNDPTDVKPDGAKREGYGDRDMTPEAFAWMMTAGWQTWYEDTMIRAACVYGWTANERWKSFRYDNAPGAVRVFMDFKVNEPDATIVRPEGPRRQATITQMPGTFVNVRQQPNATAAKRGQVDKGAVVEIVDAPGGIVDGWQYIITKDDVLEGWISLQGGRVVITPDAPIDDTITLKRETLRTLADAATKAAEAVAKLANSLAALAVLDDK